MPGFDDDDSGPVPFTTSPYLLVALPTLVEAVAPLNVSGLVREWELMIDPSRALGDTASYLLQFEEWLLGDHFATPSFETASLIRGASRDERLVEMFSVSDAYLRSGEDWISIKSMAKGGESGGLSEEAWPVLLGLAVVSSSSTPIGMNGKRLHELTAKEEQKQGLDEP